MRTRHRWLTAGGMVAALLIGMTGCANKIRNQVGAMNTSNIQRLGNLYAAFQTYKGGRGPNDEAEFKEFVRSFDPNKLAMMKVDPNNIEGLFTSERDGKPFKIRYKVGGGRGSKDVVIFEELGVGGQKQVGITGAEPMEVDDATYAAMLAGKGPSSPAPGPPGSQTATGKGPPGSRGKGRPVIGPPPGAPGPPGS